MQQRIKVWDQGMENEEEAWVMQLNLVQTDSPGKTHKRLAQKNWLIRMKPLEFLVWKVQQNIHVIFFSYVLALEISPRLL